MSTPAQIKANQKLALSQQEQTDLANMKNTYADNTKALKDTETQTINNAYTTYTTAQANATATKTQSLDLLTQQRKQVETTYSDTLTAAKATENATMATARATYASSKVTLDKNYTDAVLQRKLDYQTAVAALG
jgi:hypothetical protein